MEVQRMSNADMLQYCEEALAWPDFGPIDTLFFETVKRILTGEFRRMLRIRRRSLMRKASSTRPTRPVNTIIRMRRVRSQSEQQEKNHG